MAARSTSASGNPRRISFAKIQELLPAFRCSWDPESGARQLLEVFSRVALTHDDFVSNPEFQRYLVREIRQFLLGANSRPQR